MSVPAFSIRDDFPPVSYEDWKALAEEDLQGAPFEKLVTRTYEGVDIQPVYSLRDCLDESAIGLPGAPPYVRGAQPLGAALTGWDLRQEHLHPDPAVCQRAILEDVRGGVTSLLLRLDTAARRGHDPDDPEVIGQTDGDGVAVYCLADLEALLAEVPLDQIGVALDAGAAFLPAAALLAALWQQRGVPAESARGAFNADPLGVLASEGELPVTLAEALAQMADLAAWTSRHLPQVTAVGVNTAPYHRAGATAVQDIAFAVATGVEYLRALTESGLTTDCAARQIQFSFSLGTHQFLAISKLRAARRVWARIVEASGGSSAAAAMSLHCRTSPRGLTQRDPYVNLLRNTVAVFAAGLGGAQAITSLPLDYLIGWSDSFTRRIARNTLLILQEEAHLHRVVDPAGGSWFMERLTEEIADKAWSIFQEVERQGGMRTALRSGWVRQQIDQAYASRAKDIARRREGITGVSEFPDIREEPFAHTPPDMAALHAAAVQRIQGLRRLRTMSLFAQRSLSDHTAAAIAAAAEGATVGQLARALAFHGEGRETSAPLEPRSFAEPFEKLRDASDAWRAAHGRRPTVFLAKMGPVAHHIARATYAKNFFEAGGFEVVGEDGYETAEQAAAAFAQSGATIAVICSSDKLYPAVVPEAARQLKASGARCVVLAGNPGDQEQAWRAAGVDRFIFVKCDVLATLRDLLRQEGVLAP